MNRNSTITSNNILQRNIGGGTSNSRNNAPNNPTNLSRTNNKGATNTSKTSSSGTNSKKLYGMTVKKTESGSVRRKSSTSITGGDKSISSSKDLKVKRATSSQVTNIDYFTEYSLV